MGAVAVEEMMLMSFPDNMSISTFLILPMVGKNVHSLGGLENILNTLVYQAESGKLYIEVMLSNRIADIKNDHYVMDYDETLDDEVSFTSVIYKIPPHYLYEAHKIIQGKFSKLLPTTVNMLNVHSGLAYKKAVKGEGKKIDYRTHKLLAAISKDEKTRLSLKTKLESIIGEKLPQDAELYSNSYDEDGKHSFVEKLHPFNKWH